MMENLKKTYIMKEYLESSDIYRHLLKGITNNNLTATDLKEIDTLITELTYKNKLKKKSV